MYALAHNSQPRSALNVTHHELVFHIRPVTFDLNPNCNKNSTCISQYFSQLPEHSYYDRTVLNPFSAKHSRNLFHKSFLQLKQLCHKFLQ